MIVHCAFDNESYLSQQAASILERRHRFNNKLYLDFGGKLLHDLRTARVFKNKLERCGVRLYTHCFPRGYPTDINPTNDPNFSSKNLFVG
jgi:uncharacterized protein (UPF0371 family)